MSRLKHHLWDTGFFGDADESEKNRKMECIKQKLKIAKISTIAIFNYTFVGHINHSFGQISLIVLSCKK